MSDGQGCREQVYDFRKVDGVWQRRKLPNGRWYMLRVVKVDDGYIPLRMVDHWTQERAAAYGAGGGGGGVSDQPFQRQRRQQRLGRRLASCRRRCRS